MGYGMLMQPDKGIGGGVGQAQDGNGHVTFYVEVDDRPRSTGPANSAARRSCR
jgi:hypothetical protein